MLPRVVALVVLTLAFASRPVAALTPDDCALWMDKLGGEVAGAQIRGDQAAENRAAIMQDIDAARRSVHESIDQSEQRVRRVQRQAADLVARGQVSRVQGDRLMTLGEATRRCLEQVKKP